MGDLRPLLERMLYRFGSFTLDLAREVLLDADGQERRLRPKAFALLSLLVESAGQLVSRETIFEKIWPGVFVTDDSISLCVREIRRVLEDREQRVIRTVPRRGYLFAAEVHRQQTAPRWLEPSESSTRRIPVLTVLPFSSTSPDDQDYFADGLTDDLTTALSHLRWFSVIARGSAFTYKERQVDVRQIGRELGADYVLEGNIRRAGEWIRVTAQLSAADDARQIWAQRFNVKVQDIFALQDQLVEAVAAEIEPSLQRAEVELARARPTESLTAYDLYFRALSLRWQGTKESCDQAVVLLRRATVLDGEFAAAWGLLADLAGYRVSQGWAAPGEAKEVLVGVRRLAEGGVVDNPSALAWAGYALSFLGREYLAGLAVAQRALMLAPHSSQVLFLAGWCHLYAGEWRPAIGYLEYAMRLSPVDPLIMVFHVALSAAHFSGGQYREAADRGRAALLSRQDYLIPRRLLAASYALLGQAEAAREVVESLLVAAPTETVSGVAARTAFSGEVKQRFLQGLRLAGLPD